MSSKYRKVGVLGMMDQTRDFKRWVLVFADGEEIRLGRKKYAVMKVKAVILRGERIRIYEETVMRTVMANNEVREDSFRIEITDRVKNELHAEK